MTHILLVHSHYGAAPSLFTAAVARGIGVIRREVDLTAADFEAACGLITTSHLDQDGFLAWRLQYEALLARGGRWVFNGHILRPLLEGLELYRPIKNAKRSDLVLTDLAEHPIFEGVSRKELEENKGVAGFYGRGHNPMPEGALAITGVGPDHLPLDWVWARPEGGMLFSHAGNDVGAMGGSSPAQERIAPRLLSWTLGEL